ncbi:MAG: DNA alkylation repair protein [Acidobacteriales bacterium]|nr:DNA alkylation repair protein [Terriglobales bacterium]
MTRTTPSWVTDICDALHAGASAKHAAEVKCFFKAEVHSHGWYTAPLRRFSREWRKRILGEAGSEVLFDVAERLFRGKFNEERHCGVFLLEPSAKDFRAKEFARFEKSWMPHIVTWADHDALIHGVVSVIVAHEPVLARHMFRWAKSRDPWFRRAAAVALIRLARKKREMDLIFRLSSQLIADPDDLVQKGVGWLLREAGKANPRPTVQYLLSIRTKASRLVLRTACEKIPARDRTRVLSRV